MIGASVNSNSVHIPTIQTDCLKVEFDTTYPVHLHGIISQEEFHDSINRINRSIALTSAPMILALIFILSIIGGIVCFAVGGVTASNSHRIGFPPLIGVGIALSMVGSICFTLGCCLLQFRRTERIRQTVAEESTKYSTRSPIPCSWRLDIARQYYGGYGTYRSNQLVYHLVIDIGRSTARGVVAYHANQVVPSTGSIVVRQDDYPPPPYASQAGGFCSQCGTLRQDWNAKFCSSCGHSFNKS